MALGCAEEAGYRAGERRDGMTRRCIVWGGVDASCCCRFCSIDGNGEALADVARGIRM